MSHHSETSFFVTGGTLNVEAPCYVDRQADRDLLASLSSGEFCYVLTASQMGKSSLMVRTAQRLHQQGVRVVTLDLTAAGQNVEPEQWYDGLLLRVGQQLDLEDVLEDFWVSNSRLGPCQRFFAALRQAALPNLQSLPTPPAIATSPSGTPHPRLVLFVDEIDVVRGLPFSADEFFAAIRECLNSRSRDPELERLTFCLLGIAMPADLIKDPHRTPFNVGRRIELADFTPTEARHFLAGLQGARRLELEPRKLLDRVLYWTHGHPFLTQQLCRELAAWPPSRTAANETACVDALCDELCLSTRARESNDNLLFVRERLLRTEADLASVLDQYEKILNGREVLDDDQHRELDQLRLTGIVRTEGRRLVVRNRIYEEVFNQAWVAANKPIAELETPEGRRIRIRSNFTIGRTDANDLVLTDIKVSRRHALIQREGFQQLLLVDLGSRNGTFLNGRRVTVATPLHDRDRIDIGPHKLVLHQPNAPRPDSNETTSLDRTVIGF